MLNQETKKKSGIKSPVDYKLELYNYAIDGRVFDILERNLEGLIPEIELSFGYRNKKMRCNASVRFVIDKSNGSDKLYELAVTFVKRLK